MKKQPGFTIVELLIVIVIIAILAAITIVAYNGIQNRASDNAARSVVAQAMKSVNLFKADKDVYPTSITDCPTPASTNICLNSSGLVYSGVIPRSYAVGSIQGSRFYMASDAEVTGTNEFMQYADLAPVIDIIGLKQYKLTFDIKSANTSSSATMRVYFQNGSTSRHGGLNQIVPVTTDYVTQTVIFNATLSNNSETRSTLAFFGNAYGNGNIPSVKNVKFELN